MCHPLAVVLLFGVYRAVVVSQLPRATFDHGAEGGGHLWGFDGVGSAGWRGLAVRCTGMQCTVTTVKLSTVLMARDDSPYSYLFDTLVRFV